MADLEQGVRPWMRPVVRRACRRPDPRGLLVPKLPSPREEDLSKGILEAIDMDSYRAEKKAAMSVALTDEDAANSASPDLGRRSAEEQNRSWPASATSSRRSTSNLPHCLLDWRPRRLPEIPGRHRT